MVNPDDPAPQRARLLDRRARMTEILRRDGMTCVWCGTTFGRLILPTTEHLVPRVKGGPSWLANEVAACRRCNVARGHQGIAGWIVECTGRGWSVDLPRVLAGLDRLEAAIAQHGGARRARAHLAAQRRRLS